MKACFATNGFHGKVNCHEWAHATPDLKSLPNKKEVGGINMYRPKNCKKCGGKMQAGGLKPYTQSNTPQGSTTPTGQSSLAQNSSLTPDQIYGLAQKFGFRTDSNANLQSDLFNYAQKSQPDAYQSTLQKYGQTNSGTFVDDMLGARTSDLLQRLITPTPATPAQKQAQLTAHLFGPGNVALGMASQPYRDSQAVTDPGAINTTSPQEYVDFQYYKPNSANIDESRGRYRVPNNVWGNQITRGTNLIENPALLDPYKVQAPSMAAIKMQGGRLRMQGAGTVPRIDMSQYMQAPLDQPLPGEVPIPAQQRKWEDKVQEGIDKGLIDSPAGFQNAQQWYDYARQPSTRQAPNPFDKLQRIGLGMRALRTGLGFVGNAIERGRQNQYDYRQQTALGQMNPIQSSDFQPNPYNLYAQYGGNLNSVSKAYKEFSNNAQFDFGSGDDDQGMMKKGGYEIDRMLIVRKLLPELLQFGRMSRHHYFKNGGLSRGDDYGSAKHPYPSVDSSDFAGPHRSYPIPTHADAIDALRLAHLHGAQDVIAKVHAKYPDLQQGGQLPQGSRMVNPNYTPNTPDMWHNYQAGVQVSYPGDTLTDNQIEAARMQMDRDRHSNSGRSPAIGKRIFKDLPLQAGTYNGIPAYYEPSATDSLKIHDRVPGFLESMFEGLGDKTRLPAPENPQMQPVIPPSRISSTANNTMRPHLKSGGKWIPKHLKKGRCTPAPNPDCPVGSPQYNLAQTFKKHHGFHKKK